MHNSAQSRNGMLTRSVDPVALLEIHHLRELALDPKLAEAAAGYARARFPKASLGRVL